MARKCRDADHLICLVYEPDTIPPDVLAREIAEAQADESLRVELPDCVFDCHTGRGRAAGTRS